MENAQVEIEGRVGPPASDPYSSSSVYTSANLRLNVRVAICPDKRYMSLVADINSLTWVCHSTNSTGPQIGDCATIELNGTRASFSIAERANYRFIVISCLRDATATVPVLVTVSYRATNQASGNLAVGSVRMPMTYSLLLGLWGVAFVTWAFYTTWQWRLRNSIHQALWFVLFVKLSVAVVSFVYWTLFVRYDMRSDGLLHARSVLFASSETVMFVVFMLIAKGWLITRHTLPSAEIRGVVLALVLLLGSLLFLSFYSDDYYYMALLVMYFFMLPKVFSSLTRNGRLLQSELWVLERIDDRQQRNAAVITMHSHVRDKANLFSRLRQVIGMYLVSLLIVNSLRLGSY